eukprot:2938491-Pyramimonas_sp.AAC.1
MPKPYSALSSKRLLPQAGPLPVSLCTVYGTQPAVPPRYRRRGPMALLRRGLFSSPAASCLFGWRHGDEAS